MSICTIKAILGLSLEVVVPADVSHCCTTVVGIYSVFSTCAVEVVKATENI